MKTLTVAFAVLALVVPAIAQVEFRWFAAAGNMGVRVAGIRSNEGSYFRLTCSPEGVPGEGPGLQYESAGSRDTRRPEAVQVVVDGAAFLFELDKDGLADGSTGRSRGEMVRLGDRLAGSRTASFVVEVPRKNLSERFSLKGAQQALGKPGRTLLAGCP